MLVVACSYSMIAEAAYKFLPKEASVVCNLKQ